MRADLLLSPMERRFYFSKGDGVWTLTDGDSAIDAPTVDRAVFANKPRSHRSGRGGSGWGMALDRGTLLETAGVECDLGVIGNRLMTRNFWS